MLSGRLPTSLTRWAIAGLFLLPAAAPAQPIVETVTVNASALVGVWTVAWPQNIQISFMHGAKWGPMQDRFCRIDQNRNSLGVHCFAGDIFKDGTVSLESDKIHLAWGTMMLRAVVDGTLQSPTSYAGTFALKISGISHDDPDASAGVKLSIAADTQDKDGKSALLLAILKDGMEADIAHDDETLKKNGFDAGALPKLGAVEAVAYLGRAPKFGSETDLDFFTVYAVEFAGAERICGLHQRGDGALDAFLCV